MKLRMNRAACALLLLAATCSCLLADASFKQEIHFTGGSMLNAMHAMMNGPMGRLIGSQLNGAFDDQTYTIYLKGAKMAHIGKMISTITDLDAGTVTTIMNTRRTYSVMTFDEMKESLARMQQKMGRRAPDVEFDVHLEATGQTKQVDGQLAKEYVMTLAARPNASADAAATMKVRSDVWTIAQAPGTDELREYYRKLAPKYVGAGGIGALNPMMGGAAKGMAALAEESAKLQGYPVLSDTDVSGVAMPMNPMMADAAKADPNAPFLQMQTKSSDFSRAPVADSVFAVPSDFKLEKRRQ